LHGQRVADGDANISVETEDVTSNPEDELSSAFERSMSCMSSEEEPLPLPPPPNNSMSMTSLDSIDLLPPPPPEMCYGEVENHYHVSPLTSPLTQSKPLPGAISSLPPMGPSPLSKPKPPSIKKSNSIQKPSSRRISFDDHVQMIDAPGSPNPSAIPKYVPAAPIRNSNPKKLTWTNDAGDTNSLPRSFLDNLQKVMNKKWQVAEKCQANMDMTPHKVLGFRTDEPISKVGQPNLYSKNSAIGAWVLETQMYAHEPQYYDQDSPPQVQRQMHTQQIHNEQLQHQQQQNQLTPHLHQQQFHKQQVNQHQLQQHQLQQHKIQQQQQYFQHQQQLHLQHQQQQQEYQQQQYGHNGVYGQYQMSVAQQYGQVHQVPELEDPYGHYPGSPVVLREPEPTYVDPGRMRQNKAKRPPPPPRRSQDTQLSNMAS